jgi:hypothetical protein
MEEERFIRDGAGDGGAVKGAGLAPPNGLGASTSTSAPDGDGSMRASDSKPRETAALPSDDTGGGSVAKRLLVSPISSSSLLNGTYGDMEPLSESAL